MEQKIGSGPGWVTRFLRRTIVLGFALGLYYFVVSSAVYGHGGEVSPRVLLDRLIRSLVIANALALVWVSIWTAIDFRFKNSNRPDWSRFVLWQGGLGYGLPFGLFMGVVSIIQRNGFSRVAFFSGSSLFSLSFSLVGYLVIGCLMGLLFFKMAENLKSKSHS